MKKSFINTVSVLLTLLVVFSTFSFTLEKHFYGEILGYQDLFSVPKKCKAEIHSCCAVESSCMTKKQNSCCSNKKDKIHGQDKFIISSLSFNFLQQNFIIPLVFISGDILQEQTLEACAYRYYKPPLLAADIQVIYQVFLI